ncbi:hypothetical protein PENTCL1PPCAC_9445, partial [Pristionchus entomophagus]
MQSSLLSLLLVGAAVAISSQKSEEPPCGLPPFVDVLPAKQSKDLRETWKQWKEGGECVTEQAATHAILGTLTPEEHRAVFGGG